MSLVNALIEARDRAKAASPPWRYVEAESRLKGEERKRDWNRQYARWRHQCYLIHRALKNAVLREHRERMARAIGKTDD